jgi:hypothetical protein
MAVVSAFSALEETVVTMGCDDSTGISTAAVVEAGAETGASTDAVVAGPDIDTRLLRLRYLRE